MHVHRSPRADHLADALAKLLRTPSGGPLDPEIVVVSGRAAEQWLTRQLAQRLGIVANVRFLSPSSLLEETIGAVLGDAAAGVDAWRPDRLAWTVLATLPALIDRPAFAPVRFFLGGDGVERDVATARVVGLARRVAECFERYALARPGMVLEWDTGGGDDAADWQPALWRAVRERVGRPHLAELARDAEARLDAGAEPARAIPRRVSWMTHGSAPRLPLSMLAALARRGVEAHLLALTPSPGAAARARTAATTNGLPTTGRARYGSGMPGEHPLVASLGRAGRDFELLLKEVGIYAGDDDGACRKEPDHGGDTAKRRSMLRMLQAELRAGRTRRDDGHDPAPVSPTDDSVRVHACHGRLRQVEVLHEELLRLFDRHPDLEPRHVLVLSPSLADYAPMVDAVFSTRAARSGPGDPPPIPVRIADMPLRRVNDVAEAMLRALAMAGSAMDAESMLGLFTLAPVAARHGLDGAAQERLLEWVRESGIRRTLDGEHRAARGLPATCEHTWRFGLDRLLLGTAMPGDGRSLFAGVLPYDEIEGQEAEVLGRFADACERILGRLRGYDRTRPMTEWRSELSALVTDLVSDDDAALAGAIHSVRAALAGLADDAEAAGLGERVELGAVRLLLEARFGEAVAMGGGAGAVTFAALTPGRVVPARVIALLGMDEECFPRRRSALGFDLVAREPRVGDADPATDDRQRFLEVLLAAEDHLLVTCTGRALDTNAPVAPAVPVDELLAELDAAFVIEGAAANSRVRDLVRVGHALQPFSARNFGADGAPARGWDAAWLSGARALAGEQRELPPFLTRPLADDDAPADVARVVTLDELASFMAHPSRELLARRLSLTLHETDATIETREPMELGHLESYSLRSELLGLAGDGMLDGEIPDVGMHDDTSPPVAERLLRAAGRLPHGAPGVIIFRGAAREALAISRAADVERGDSPDELVTVEQEVGGVRLVGRVGPVYGDRLVWCRPGSVRDEDLLRLWVHHLALQAALGDATPVTSVMVGRPGNGANVVELAPVDDPLARLAELIAYHEAGLRQRFPFFPGTSRAFAHAMTREAGERRADEMIRAASAAAFKVWAPGSDHARGDGDDRHVSLLFADWAPVDVATSRPDPHFEEIALTVWTPILDHLTERSTTA
ncbi:MAG TPA: exodeoxyribonuclease V subunit gamma [Gemmatimonadales bacterium]